MRPIVATALRNPISRIGVALTTASALLFLLLLILDLAGLLQNPYVGLVVFVMVPAFFVFGLLLVPAGAAYERRRAARGLGPVSWAQIDLNDPGSRRAVLLLVVATLANIMIVGVASFGAVEYTESQAFCGQACHTVMEPEFVAHQGGSHARVHCVACHVGPGAGGFLTAKLNGTRQLALALTGSYARPIPVPVANMPDVRTSCEDCHWPDRFVGDKIRVIYEHANDEANTRSMTTVRLHVGGAVAGAGSGTGIHWHMNRSNVVEYSALDDKREQIPYVRVSTPDGTVREYFSGNTQKADVEGKPLRQMNCLDCHSRVAHSFGSSPEREVDAAIGQGQISEKIPFIRREAVRAVGAEYMSQDVAMREIERSIRGAMNESLPHSFEEADLRRAIGITQAIYRRNVFPSMRVKWGIYPNQGGHVTTTGCFRCHDDEHKTATGVVIKQDCELCHSIE